VRLCYGEVPPYQSIFSKMSYGERMLDKAFYEEEVKRECLAFEQQMGKEEKIDFLCFFGSLCKSLLSFLDCCKLQRFGAPAFMQLFESCIG
ncbi:hypothetical protein IFM89_003781, partial [Coptis chinensis]